MDELRVVRREDQSLIVAGEDGVEHRLIVDSSVFAELRHLHRQAAGGSRINPREIQALVRAGRTRGEIAELTGADENDIERYEEPVLAERRFVLQNAQAVPVRTSPSEQAEQQFGSVIAERLIGLGARGVEWSSWRDEDAGWMIGLDFESHDVAHHAVWAFEHRKGVLSPLTPDAETLSRQGEVGDRLIPKLRAVDASESRSRFDSGAFDHEGLEAVLSEPAEGDPEVLEDTVPGPLSPATEAAMRAGHPSTGSIPVVGAEDEFARRREIDQRAIKSPEPELPDLGQTADLLDALRRRRGAREEARQGEFDLIVEEQENPPKPVPLRGLGSAADDQQRGPFSEAEQPAQPENELTARHSADVQPTEPRTQDDAPPAETSKRGKGRTSIPSWDDILFGTRSDEDPA